MPKLYYGTKADKGYAFFMSIVKQYCSDFVTSDHQRARDLVKLRTDRPGLEELATKFLDLDKKGDFFWPSNPGQPNYRPALQYANATHAKKYVMIYYLLFETKLNINIIMIRIHKYMVQLFCRVNITERDKIYQRHRLQKRRRTTTSDALLRSSENDEDLEVTDDLEQSYE